MDHQRETNPANMIEDYEDSRFKYSPREEISDMKQERLEKLLKLVH